MTLAFVALIALGQPVLEMPWECGEIYATSDSPTNVDGRYWFMMPLTPTPPTIRAAAGGTVRLVKEDSNIGGCDAQYADAGNYVVVDHGDGTEALYLHLAYNSVPVQVGDTVVTGQALGVLGETGWVCGTHLHFQLQEAGDHCYYCNNVTTGCNCNTVPAQFYGYENLTEGQQYISNNCGSCTAMLDGSSETVIDDENAACFKRFGPGQWWWDAENGYSAHHYYTYATPFATMGNYGEWHFNVTHPGRYSVEVYVPLADAESQQADYGIYADGMRGSFVLDQNSNKGWQSIGTYRFTGAPGEKIQLADNTGEPESPARKVAFDAVRLSYMSSGGDDDNFGGDDDLTQGDDEQNGDTDQAEGDTFSGDSASSGDTFNGDTAVQGDEDSQAGDDDTAEGDNFRGDQLIGPAPEGDYRKEVPIDSQGCSCQGGPAGITLLPYLFFMLLGLWRARKK